MIKPTQERKSITLGNLIFILIALGFTLILGLDYLRLREDVNTIKNETSTLKVDYLRLKKDVNIVKNETNTLKNELKQFKTIKNTNNQK